MTLPRDESRDTSAVGVTRSEIGRLYRASVDAHAEVGRLRDEDFFAHLRDVATKIVDHHSREQLIDSMVDLLEQAEYLHRVRSAAWGGKPMTPLTIPDPPPRTAA